MDVAWIPVIRPVLSFNQTRSDDRANYPFESVQVGLSNHIYEATIGLVYDGLYRHLSVLEGGTAAGSLAFMVPSNEVSSLLLICY